MLWTEEIILEGIVHRLDEQGQATLELQAQTRRLLEQNARVLDELVKRSSPRTAEWRARAAGVAGGTGSVVSGRSSADQPTRE